MIDAPVLLKSLKLLEKELEDDLRTRVTPDATNRHHADQARPRNQSAPASGASHTAVTRPSKTSPDRWTITGVIGGGVHVTSRSGRDRTSPANRNGTAARTTRSIGVSTGSVKE